MRIRPLIAALALASCVSVDSAHAASYPDKIVAQGDTLRGRVARFTSEYFAFSTKYGRGTIEIPYDSVQTVILVGDYVVLYDEFEELRGPIVGLVGDSLVIGVSQDSVIALQRARIRGGIALEDFGDTWLDRTRRRWRYWSMTFDLGWELEDGALVKRKIDAGINIQRRKEPTRVRGRPSAEVRYAAHGR